MRDSIAIIGWTMLLFGILLWWADTKMPMQRQAETWTFKHALILGFWQALALIPGTSRSGITITGARLLGYKRIDAARLSMLMSIPTILAAGGMETLDIIGQKSSVPMGDILLAVAFSAIAAFVALSFMMRWLKSISFTPYVIYRVVLGIGLLGLAYL
jgi:undecaprenyl-diphosphatase